MQHQHKKIDKNLNASVVDYFIKDLKRLIPKNVSKNWFMYIELI